MSYLKDNVICTRKNKMQLSNVAYHEAFNKIYAKANNYKVLNAFEQQARLYLDRTIEKGL